MRKQLDKNLSFHKLVAYMIALMTGKLMRAFSLYFFIICSEIRLPIASFKAKINVVFKILSQHLSLEQR